MSEIKLRFKVKKECKHSRRYECQDENSPITDIYVGREFANDKDEFVMIITEVKK